MARCARDRWANLTCHHAPAISVPRPCHRNLLPLQLGNPPSLSLSHLPLPPTHLLCARQLAVQICKILLHPHVRGGTCGQGTLRRGALPRRTLGGSLDAPALKRLVQSSVHSVRLIHARRGAPIPRTQHSGPRRGGEVVGWGSLKEAPLRGLAFTAGSIDDRSRQSSRRHATHVDAHHPMQKPLTPVHCRA